MAWHGIVHAQFGRKHTEDQARERQFGPQSHQSTHPLHSTPTIARPPPPPSPIWSPPSHPISPIPPSHPISLFGRTCEHGPHEDVYDVRPHHPQHFTVFRPRPRPGPRPNPSPRPRAQDGTRPRTQSHDGGPAAPCDGVQAQRGDARHRGLEGVGVEGHAPPAHDDDASVSTHTYPPPAAGQKTATDHGRLSHRRPNHRDLIHRDMRGRIGYGIRVLLYDTAVGHVHTHVHDDAI